MARQCNGRFEPKLRLPVRMGDMHVHSHETFVQQSKPIPSTGGRLPLGQLPGACRSVVMPSTPTMIALDIPIELGTGACNTKANFVPGHQACNPEWHSSLIVPMTNPCTVTRPTRSDTHQIGKVRPKVWAKRMAPPTALVASAPPMICTNPLPDVSRLVPSPTRLRKSAHVSASRHQTR